LESILWPKQLGPVDRCRSTETTKRRLRRRLVRSYDWSGHYYHSLDGIPEIHAIGGGGIDGCRSHKEVRAIVLELLRQIQKLRDENAALLADSAGRTEGCGDLRTSPLHQQPATRSDAP
jgi:hypothetical protein